MVGFFRSITFRMNASVPLRAYVATRQDNVAATRKREATTAALRRYVTERRLVDAVRRAIQ